ncbi:DUF2975 domain-containing protein [Aquirufa nivalisilvae]|uniref:DUF2975 domain-containing protein n=1 Tax=Aquirufa nivalisilvae TaxID=2516557 RepID=A0A2S2DYJ1_9BACT|nr:DUF2975 domain-containing protein [Aquirufa nivalisilvae]AWL10465.1 hypothetical protein HME7025_02625 [Aquirufa nivalisilvae]MCZ2479632.1 DUF2975 domain-containing protein [Aquirufa nivalisilvae]MCZ2481625.1 DUF2975 domain-containing protein [Aquirufa nivalisilvae]
MKTKTASILATLNVLSWIAYIGISIKCGAIIFTYILSLFNQQVAKDLYQGLNLYDLMHDSFVNYSLFVGITTGLLAIKAYVAQLVIQVLSKINLKSPFDMEVAQLMEKISLMILVLWVLSLGASIYQELMELPNMDWNGGEALFLSGLIFLFAQIFKKGVEIQAENDLTV